MTLTAVSQNFAELCNEGIKQITNKNYEKAQLLFAEAAATGTTNEEKAYAHANLAYSQQMCGDLVNALRNYNSAISHDSTEIALFLQRANIYLRLDSTEKALKDYNRILEKEPYNSGALYIRAGIHAGAGNLDAAKRDYKALLAMDPDNANARLGFAMLYQKEKKYNECLMLLGLLIEESPGNSALYIARSNVEREMGYRELALMDVEKAINIEPGNAGYYKLQAILLEECGKKDAAKKSRKNAELLEAAGKR